MEAVRQYIICVTAAAILCGILSAMVSGKNLKPVWKLISGIFLTLTAIHPLADVDPGALPVIAEEYSIHAEEAVQAGKYLAASGTQTIIKSRLEAYILDKANGMGVSLTADVSLDENGLPISVRLRGKISPGAKSRLQTIIENDLGIPKEAQAWSG